MTATNLSYYAFVSRFVDAVTGQALNQEMRRLQQTRSFFKSLGIELDEARTEEEPVIEAEFELEHRQAA